MTGFSFLRSERRRLRFGPPDTILVYRCDQDGGELHLVKSWRGGTPPMGLVADCGHVLRIGGQS